MTSAAAVASADRHFEDYVPGMSETLGPIAMTEGAIVEFAESSEDVSIVFDPAVAVWMNGESEYAGAPLVLCAYIAGSLRAQHETHIWRDDPYSGLQQVVRVYARLKAKDAKLALPVLDALAKDYAQGKLAARVAEIETARAKK